MRKKILISICMLVMLLFGTTTALADFVVTEEPAEEMEMVKAFTSGDSMTLVSQGKEDKIAISLLKGDTSVKSVIIQFGDTNMNTATMAVSGSAVTLGGDYSLFAALGKDVSDGRPALVVKLALEQLEAGTYTAVFNTGCITVKDNAGKTYQNEEVTLEIQIYENAPELTKPVLVLDGSVISWKAVEGAKSYKLTYYEDGEEPKNGSRMYSENNKLNDNILTSFPYQPGKKYTVKLTAYPFYGSTEGGVDSEELVIWEKMGSERAVAPNTTDLTWEYSDVLKLNTLLQVNNANENMQYFVCFYADEKAILYTRGTKEIDLADWLYKVNKSFYAEVCAVDLTNPKLAASEWVRTEIITLKSDEILSDLENVDAETLNTEQIQILADALIKSSDSVENVADMLMKNDKEASRNGYANLEAAAASSKNVTVDNNVADDVKDLINAAAIKTAGLALNAEKNANVALEVKKPEKEMTIPAGYNTSTAVQFDIDVPAIEEFKYPVMITLPIPASLSASKTIVIFHKHDNGEVEKIYPVINGDGTITFAVTDFSVFAFANETAKKPTYVPDNSTDDDDDDDSSLSSSNSSSNRVSSSVTTSTVKPAADHTVGEWKKNEKGWWYEFKDKSYVVNQWKQIGTKWFFFDEAGYMAEGWKQISGKWYYLNPVDGYMAEGWKLVGGKWYYLNPVDGYMAEGWKLVEGKWYYLKPGSGECLMNTVTPDGYTVDKNGVWVQ